ncbi:MAG TPA: alpha/beta hydrolase [Prosthecobacter sp.]
MRPRSRTQLALSALVACTALLTHGHAFAQAKPAQKPFTLPAGIKMEKDISYIAEGDAAQKLDLYLPEKATDKPLPLIVHIHGGGWRGGNKFPCPVAGMVLKGYAVASIEYRFSQKAVFPAQIQDCQAALRWLRAHSQQYHFDTEHVGVVGASAGGHLSALVGTAGGKNLFPKIGGNEEQSERVQAVCDIFGPADFSTVVQQAAEDKNVKNIFQFNSPSDPYSSLIGSKLDDKPKADAVSPVHHVSADNPPFLILHGTHDTLVPYAQSEEFADALKDKGVPVWLQKLPGSGHGGPAFGKPAVLQLTQNFFDKYLKGTDTAITLVPENEVAVDSPKPVVK